MVGKKFFRAFNVSSNEYGMIVGIIVYLAYQIKNLKRVNGVYACSLKVENWVRGEKLGGSYGL